MDSWVLKVKNPFAKAKNRRKIGVLAFEFAGILSKLLHLHQSLTDRQITRLRHDVIAQQGVRKIVSNDDTFLLGLACAETVETLRLLRDSISRLARRSSDESLRKFESSLRRFADFGEDCNKWVLSTKEMEVYLKKAARYLTVTAKLYSEMVAISTLEASMRKGAAENGKKAANLADEIECRKHEVKYLKESSLWCRDHDTMIGIIARLLFTVISRVKVVFRHGEAAITLTRSSSVSSAVHPSLDTSDRPGCSESSSGFFDLGSKMLHPPEFTLGSAALGLHYANLIVVVEKMVRTPHLIGVDARDDLYSMLPASIRGGLRDRLHSCQSRSFRAIDPGLADEWREAMAMILNWLSPVAHNTIRWYSERNFEQHRILAGTNVLLLQTLFFANKAKTEAAITEVLVGLNYVWRYEKELCAMAYQEMKVPKIKVLNKTD